VESGEKERRRRAESGHEGQTAKYTENFLTTSPLSRRMARSLSEGTDLPASERNIPKAEDEHALH